jgi:two-component sensor histidine kinase
VSTLVELARKHTLLDNDDQAHLQRLVATWGLLADLSFGDLLLFAPLSDDETHFVILGQSRPTTAQTVHSDDLVGKLCTPDEVTLVSETFRTGNDTTTESIVRDGSITASLHCVPVRHDGTIIAVLTQETPLRLDRQPGQLEQMYSETFDLLLNMVRDGAFPFPTDAIADEAPRVGDGTLILDADQRVRFASPNAMNALHRMGINAKVDGLRLADLGVPERVVISAMTSRLPTIEEIEPSPDVIVRVHAIPLLRDDSVAGGLVLVRDVSDLRRRDRLLLSKDQAIKEVHHRVKNNLQTISALLRLQARRMGSPDARAALDEAERRIRSIAVVHEVLSRDPGDQVGFDEILETIVRMAEEGLTSPEHIIEFEIEGDAGKVPAEVATPLAVIITELLQNAVEHAFPETLASPDGVEGRFHGRVLIELNNDGERLYVRVEDNGMGLPEGFSLSQPTSLGLSIVRDLVRSQLCGTIDMRSEVGTIVEIEVPLDVEESKR